MNTDTRLGIRGIIIVSLVHVKFLETQNGNWERIKERNQWASEDTSQDPSEQNELDVLIDSNFARKFGKILASLASK